MALVDLLCKLNLRICGTGAWDTSTLKSMDVLRRIPDSGVDYNGDIQAWNVCAVGNSNQQAHPKKQATYNVQHAFQLVTIDLMGPIKPAALGGYSYVTKFVD